MGARKRISTQVYPAVADLRSAAMKLVHITSEYYLRNPVAVPRPRKFP